MRHRSAAALTMVLLAACASPTAMLDEQVLQCGPGQAIEIQAGLDAPRVQMRTGDDNLVLLVEVSNNSHEELTVSRIRAQQAGNESQAGYQIDPVTRNFDQAIEEGKSHLFELPVFGRPTGLSDPRQRGGEIVFAVTVTLTNGDSYLCRYGVRAPV